MQAAIPGEREKTVAMDDDPNAHPTRIPGPATSLAEPADRRSGTPEPPGAELRDFMRDLGRGRTGVMLRDELTRRWPETTDRLETIVRYALLPAGKLLRPIMTLSAAEAVGGDPAPVLPAALAMEYIHAASLVHDDIIDDDDVRRGRPSVHVAHGVPDAIVAGDHLIFTAFTAIGECRTAGVPYEPVGEAMRVLAAAGADLCRGLILENRLAGRADAGFTAYLEMVRLKTGALFRAVCHVGAILGGAGPEQARALAAYGEHLGIAFQIRDDLLAYTVSEREAGKPPASDLGNGRPTAPFLFAWEAGTPAERERLGAALRDVSATPEDLARIGALLRRTGALERSHEFATEHSRRAEGRLAGLEPSPGADVLAAIARWARA